jgi:RNA polymerase sigma factor for flagellar operon FliA
MLGFLIAAIGLSTAAEIYLQHLQAIDRIASSMCRRHGIRGADAEDFASEVRLRLLEDEYAVIRKHRGDSSVTTFLTVVIANLLRDYRIKMWGKWRPSAEAKRLGEAAILLETSMYRDGFSFEDACALLERDARLDVDRTQLREIAKKLPVRAPRRIEGEEALAEVPAISQSDGRVLEAERVEQHTAMHASVTRWIETLANEDQLIIKLRFYEGLSVADVAPSAQCAAEATVCADHSTAPDIVGCIEEGGHRTRSIRFFRICVTLPKSSNRVRPMMIEADTPCPDDVAYP